MCEFKIKSTDTDLEVVFSNKEDDYFTVKIYSNHLMGVQRVWGYTDAYTFANLFEWIASQKKPWNEKQTWESIEGEFKFSATCSLVGKVKFEIELNENDSSEQWKIKTQVSSEFGQLPTLAKQSRKFFGKSP